MQPIIVPHDDDDTANNDNTTLNIDYFQLIGTTIFFVTSITTVFFIIYPLSTFYPKKQSSKNPSSSLNKDTKSAQIVEQRQQKQKQTLTPPPSSLLLEREAQIVALRHKISTLERQLKEQQTIRQQQQQQPPTIRRNHHLTAYSTLIRTTSRNRLLRYRKKMTRGVSITTSAILDALPSDDVDSDEEDDDDNETRANNPHSSNNESNSTKANNPHSSNNETRANNPHSSNNESNSTKENNPHSSNSSNKDEHTVHKLARKIIKVFDNPSSNTSVSYLNSPSFAHDLIALSSIVRPLLEEEPRCLFLQSPCYVFGDIHGNLEDLHFFADNVWRLGLSLTAGNFLFLGDYVDRGMSCLEVVAYLLSLKLLHPVKVYLLRGNHETRDVNGWEEYYGNRSFVWQCRDRFGSDLGTRLWEKLNRVFDRLPLAAVIDQDIFCVHGGIPRPLSSKTSSSRIRDILKIPKVAGINPPYDHERPSIQRVASDCIWSDPASEEQEISGIVDPHSGFGESLRGGGAICFGHKAVTNFLQQEGFSYIMRAHEAHAEGVAISKGARVFTLFSTSKDHNQGSQAKAGCMLVDFEKMQVINRSPAYKNCYVHRRDSVSINQLNVKEIDERMKLGLITPMDQEDTNEEWDDFDVDEEESDYDSSSSSEYLYDDSDDDEEDTDDIVINDTKQPSFRNDDHHGNSNEPPPTESNNNMMTHQQQDGDETNTSTKEDSKTTTATTTTTNKQSAGNNKKNKKLKRQSSTEIVCQQQSSSDLSHHVVTMKRNPTFSKLASFDEMSDRLIFNGR